MNTMTGIAREAMRRAQAGDWALADAIELLSRERDGGLNAACEAACEDDVQLLCGIPEGGRLRYLVWVNCFDGLECQACHTWNGDDEAVGTDEPCAECMDQRIHSQPFQCGMVWDRVQLITNLNGDLVWSATGEVDLPYDLLSHDTHQMPAAAMRLVAEYQESLGKVEQPHIQIPEAA